jgi:collagenase-like PrtC family protease
MIELLAPAKNKICAKAAIDYGADAVYISANEFGARKNAANSLEDIAEVVEYAHKFNVKIYVTINTILTDDEIIRAKDLIKKLSKVKVDAVIIQDFGLIEILNSEDFPQIAYHSSTQCNNETVEKVKFLEDAGFSRVILARELSIEQIREIKKQTNVELETFIHGALCVSYSGQCYLSYLIGGRSANRGECAQPCRKKYSLIDEDGNIIAKNQYLLSLKDFNASAYIKELVQAGVTSFKIEGRLKDENYVKNVVAYYRKIIDNLNFKKTSSGEILFDFIPNPEKTFNRGFTTYFLEKRQDCFDFLTPKSKGEYIGRVVRIEKNFFEIHIGNAKSISSQDGLCFFDKNELVGLMVNKVDIVNGNNLEQRIFPNKINGLRVGTEIYRNFNSKFEKQLKNSKTCRKILANIEVYLGKIKITDEDNNTIEINYTFKELAQNKEEMEKKILNQLKKSGESDFLIKNIQIKTEKIPFLPVSEINKIRCDLLEKLISERLKQYNLEMLNNYRLKSDLNVRYPQKEFDYRGNVLNKYAKHFYEKHGCKIIEPALESQAITSLKTPRCAMITKHCLKYAFNMCKSKKNLYLTDEKNKKYKLKFNCKECNMEIYF